MTISKFTAEIKNRGLARTNRYNVEIPFPNTDADGSQLVTLFCDAVNLPGMNVATTPQRMYGETREMPYERMFDPVTLTVYVDTGFNTKAAFERWIHLIINQDSRTVNYYRNYVRDVTIHVYAVDEVPTPDYSITLYECYPKAIQSIQMDAMSKEVMKLQVQLQYRYWKSTASENVGQPPVYTNTSYFNPDFEEDPLVFGYPDTPEII